MAVARNGVIGRGGRLPWRLATDLQRFKQLTWDHTIVMGRRTWESLDRLLPHRRHIVLTRQPNYRREGITIAANWPEVMELCQPEPEVFVIGGAEIFLLALPWARRAYVTEVDCHMEGDTFLELTPLRGWTVVREVRVSAGPRDEFPHTFRVLERPDLQ